MTDKLIITRSADFTTTIQLTTEPYEEGLLIDSSTAANPAVITTQLPHQLASNDRVRISGHRKNTIVNGKQTVTVIDALNFSVPVTGAVAGESTGRVGKALTTAGGTLTGKTKLQSGGSEIATAVPALTTIVAADGDVQIDLTKVQTATLTAPSCIIEITFIDAANFTRVFSIPCEVVNA